MDALDFSIYRFLSPGGEARFWAGRRIVDPRITPRQIAERVGVSESGVRTRLRRLAERGFLRDTIVVPNPSLFSQQVFVADLHVRQSGEVERMLRDLALLDGVVFARDILDEEERKLQVYFVVERDSAATRFGALLGRLSPAGKFLAPRPYFIPACDRALSSMEWKVLRAVWQRPEASFAELAKSVGISLKTVARVYRQLIDSRACWWTHGPQSEEFPLALVRVDLPHFEKAGSVSAWITQGAHAWMPLAADGFGLEPSPVPAALVGLVPADAPAVLERFLTRLAGVEGVGRVRRTFALGSAIFTAWCVDRIDRSFPGAR
jgi:DNA-binding Lrp family transcriptional regulator